MTAYSWDDDAPTLVMDSTLVIDRALLGLKINERERAAMRAKMTQPPPPRAATREATPLPLSPDVTQPSRLRLVQARETRRAAAVAIAVAFVAGIAAAFAIEMASSAPPARPAAVVRIPRYAATGKRALDVRGSVGEIQTSDAPTTTASARGASAHKRLRSPEAAPSTEPASEDHPRDVDGHGLLDDALGHAE